MPKFNQRFKELRNERDLSQQELATVLGISKSSVNMYERGEREPGIDLLEQIADFFNVDLDYLSGKSNTPNKTEFYAKVLKLPKSAVLKMESNFTLTSDYVTFPIMGEIAAGYDHLAVTNNAEIKIDIPIPYLKGRPQSDYFVLQVKGNSMFPEYHNGDFVLILKQETMDYSGQVGAVLYNDELASLKKVEYAQGEDWLKLVPINPHCPIEEITGESLEHCKILGIPKLLIRDIKK